jgi:hypothetical protein
VQFLLQDLYIVLRL